MGSVLTWTANGVLFVLGCFLAADTANEVIAAALLPAAPEAVAPRAAPAPPRPRTWAERQIILTRNLFNSSTQTPPPTAAQIDADLEKSQLPVTLLGTFAASVPALSRATLLDKEKNETLVVGVGDQIKSVALVTRIERRRVVLTENGAPRELTIGDDESAPPSVQRANARRRAPARAARSPIRRTESGIAVSREDVQQTIRNPGDLLSQARVLPKFEDGKMVGVQVNGIQPGSIFEELGLREGDVITQFNGITIDSPLENAKIMQELANGRDFSVVVRGADGTETTHNVTAE
jgi:general secretion pathway protein C